MKLTLPVALLIALSCTVLFGFCQKINGDIFIPMSNRSEIWLKPKMDTLDNKKKYEFRIHVAADLKVSQFLFEKGLAAQNDSTLVIKPNSQKDGGIDTCTLRVIVTTLKGSRIILFQKRFIVRVPEKVFPVLSSNPRTNLIKLNDREVLQRNSPYPKDAFINKQPFVSLYNNEHEMRKLDVKGVTVSIMEKEGKQYISDNDTISLEAVRELKKIRNPTPVYIKVDAMNGKSKVSVWNRIILYEE